MPNHSAPTEIQVSFDGKPHTTGLIGSVTWANPDTMRALRSLFACKDYEKIVGVTVSDKTIVAYLKTEPPPNHARPHPTPNPVRYRRQAVRRCDSR